MAADSGIYLIEMKQDIIKIGRSKQVSLRIDTHIRTARANGHDPYRWVVFSVPVCGLSRAEKLARDTIEFQGGKCLPSSREFYSGVYYNIALKAVEEKLVPLNNFYLSLDRFRSASPGARKFLLQEASPDVQVIMNYLLELGDI